MCNNKFSFILMSFHFKTFNSISFREEILFLSKELDKKHNFDRESIYFLNLTEPNGAIIMKFPIKLSSLEGNDKNIDILYRAISCYLDGYIKNSILFDFDYHITYSIYFSTYTKNDIL